MSARLELEDGTRYPLTDQPILIGRGDQCDVILAHEKVSKRHAKLSPGSPWTIEDLGSSNGTRVDGGPKLEAGEVTELGPTAELTFGAVRVRFTNFSPKPLPAEADSDVPRSARAQRDATSEPSTSRTPPAATRPAAAAPPSPAPSQPNPSATASPERGAPSSRRARSRQRLPGSTRSTVSVVTLAVLSLVIFGGLAAGLFWVYRWATPKPESIARTEAETPPPEAPKSNAVAVETARAPAADTSDTAPRRREDLNSTEDDAPITRREPRTDIGDDPFDEPRLDDAAADSEATESAESPRSSETPAVSVTPAPRDPFAEAEEIQHAGTLAELIRAHRGHPTAAAVRARLEAGTILSITWRGALPATAHAVLGRQLPLHCTPEEESIIRAVAPKAVFVPCDVSVEYRQDYSRGLGRKIGKTRLAPHPKTVEWSITREERGKQVRVGTVEAKTPRIPAAELGDLGLSELEVWTRTVDRRADKLRSTFGRLTRG